MFSQLPAKWGNGSGGIPTLLRVVNPFSFPPCQPARLPRTPPRPAASPRLTSPPSTRSFCHKQASQCHFANCPQPRVRRGLSRAESCEFTTASLSVPLGTLPSRSQNRGAELNGLELQTQVNMSIWGRGRREGEKRGLSVMTLQSARVGEENRKGGRMRNPHQDVGLFFSFSLD